MDFEVGVIALLTALSARPERFGTEPLGKHAISSHQRLVGVRHTVFNHQHHTVSLGYARWRMHKHFVVNRISLQQERLEKVSKNFLRNPKHNTSPAPKKIGHPPTSAISPIISE